MPVDFSVTNQLASPAIYASSFATRPAASFKGRLFVDTDTPSTGIYRDTGTAWVAIAGTSVGEIQSLNDVCVVGNYTTALGIFIYGDSAMGTYDGGVLNVAQAGYVLSIGVPNGGNKSIYTDADCLISGMVLGNGSATPGGAIIQNTILGYDAMINNSAGNNTAVGSNSLKLNESGEGNTAVGSFSLQNNKFGNYNTAIGSNAGGNNTGDGNTFLGYDTQGGSMFHNYNVVIGYSAAAPPADNQFVVGSITQNAGAVTNEVNASTKVWNVYINGVAQKILLA